YVLVGNLFYPVEYDGPSNSWQQTGPPSSTPRKPARGSPLGSFSNPNPPPNAPTVGQARGTEDPRMSFPAEQGLYDPASKYWYTYSGGKFWPVEYDGNSNSWRTTGPGALSPIKPQNGSPAGYFSNPNPPSNANLTSSIHIYDPNTPQWPGFESHTRPTP